MKINYLFLALNIFVIHHSFIIEKKERINETYRYYFFNLLKLYLCSSNTNNNSNITKSKNIYLRLHGLTDKICS